LVNSGRILKVSGVPTILLSAVVGSVSASCDCIDVAALAQIVLFKFKIKKFKLKIILRNYPPLFPGYHDNDNVKDNGPATGYDNGLSLSG
jgi:hypothetical protein